MINSLKPYPAYKDSGVPWLGKVPELWDVRRLRYVVRGKLMYGANAAAEYLNPEWPRYLRITDFRLDGTLRADTFRSLPPEVAKDYMVQSGDILLARSGATVGKAFIVAESEGPACHAGYLIRARPNRAVIEPAFLFAFTQSKAFAEWKDATFIVATIQNIGADKYADLPVPIPPRSDQSSITRFLAYADRRIRRYIRAKQTLIGLLNEQKLAIILRAVTRGLDPKVPVKPSGVEWLGDIPAHWDVRRNGQLFIQRNETGFDKLPILEVSLKTGVRVRGFETSDRKQVMSDRAKYKRAVKGDIAYNMMRMWQGAVGIAPIDGLVSPAYVVARPLKGTEPRYFCYLFRTVAYMAEVDKYSRGIVKDRNRLYWEDFKQMPSPYPPPSEQVKIADVIELDTRTANSAIDHANREIDLLREYRTRLIADIVTGKLDVRHVALPIPDESDGPEPLDNADALAEDTESGGDVDFDAAHEEVEA